MLKKGLIFSSAILLLTACGGYTDDQANAATQFCDCMEADTYGDFDINWLECDMEIMSEYPQETFSDDGWSLALEETCPSVAGEIAEIE